MKQIDYNEIEFIYGDSTIIYKNDLYKVVEDLKLFPVKVTLLENVSKKVKRIQAQIKKNFENQSKD